MSKLKVYGCGQPVHRGIGKFRNNKNGQVRTVMATTSWKKFSEALASVGCQSSAYELCNYGCITGNAQEIALCLANPEQLFYTPGQTTEGAVWDYLPWDYMPTKEELAILASRAVTASRIKLMDKILGSQ